MESYRGVKDAVFVTFRIKMHTIFNSQLHNLTVIKYKSYKTQRFSKEKFKRSDLNEAAMHYQLKTGLENTIKAHPVQIIKL